MQNRRLLVSVQNAQEAREAILGGGRIIDSEDPATALGNIPPTQIMGIADSVLSATRGLDLQLSTNIGEDQLLFGRPEDGVTVPKTIAEMAGKAAQSALGVAAAMGTAVHPTNIVKVGVDGMLSADATSVLKQVVATLVRSDHFWQSRVMAVFFVQDLDEWDERKQKQPVRRALVEAGQYVLAQNGATHAFNIAEAFPDGGGPLDEGSYVKLREPPSHDAFLGGDSWREPDGNLLSRPRRTNRDVLKAMVDCAAEAGAHAVMLDTSVQMKAAHIVLFDTSGSDEVVNVNSLISNQGLPEHGILQLEDLRFFVDYCHFRSLEANLAGSIASYHAQQLWALIPELDQLSNRGASSGVATNPAIENSLGEDTRKARVIRRELVRGVAPPEEGGALNFPDEQSANRPLVDAFARIVALANKQLPWGQSVVRLRSVNNAGQVVKPDMLQGRP